MNATDKIQTSRELGMNNSMRALQLLNKTRDTEERARQGQMVG